MATSPARTDRWKTLDFGPPPSGAQEPDLPVLVEYTPDERDSGHHAEPAARRQRDHHSDGGAPDRDPRDDRGSPCGPRRHPHRSRPPGLLRRQRPAAAQRHDQRGLAAAAPGLRPHPLHASASCESRFSPPSTGSPTGAAASSPRALISSSRPTMPPSASPKRCSASRPGAVRQRCFPACSPRGKPCRC